jgi:hypothetical protein
MLGSNFSRPSANVVLRRSDGEGDAVDGSAGLSVIRPAAIPSSDKDEKRDDVDVEVMPTFPLNEMVFEKTRDKFLKAWI